MTYETSVIDVTRELATLLTRGGRVPPVDRPAVRVARDAIVLAFLEIYRDVTAGVAEAESLRKSHESLAAAVGAHPVAGLRALARTVRPAPFPDVRTAPPLSETARRWAKAAGHASAAQLAWGRRDARSDWPRVAAWSAVAECASIIEAVGLLDADLSRARGERLSPLLRLAATDVRRLATSSDLPPLPDLPLAIDRPMRVITPRDAAAGMEQFASLIEGAQHLGPLGLGTLAQTTARMAARLAMLAGLSDLIDHARILAQATGRGTYVISQAPTSPAALLQAQQLARVLRTSSEDAARHGRATTDSADTWTPVALRLPKVTLALARVAKREFDGGAWRVAITTSHDRVRWQPTSTDLETPRLIVALGAAADHASNLPSVASRHAGSRVVDTGLAAASESRLQYRPARPILAPRRGLAL